MSTVVVIGGTGGLGREVARHYLDRGREVVISGRDPEQTAAVALELGGKARAVAVELTRPEQIASALTDIGEVDRLVLSAIDRGGANSVENFDIAPAASLAIQKLVGYIEVVHALRSRLSSDAAIVIFGGQARVRPYPGSTMVSTVNGGVIGMVRAMSVELAPIRVNSIHPGIVDDSPFWLGKPLDHVRAGTLTGRCASMSDVVDGVVFLLENPSANGIDLALDGGWR
jgi:NAD(P)-dependent dehydrogenase (short-subunit alcohol dehydrogenase family)